MVHHLRNLVNLVTVSSTRFHEDDGAAPGKVQISLAPVDACVVGSRQTTGALATCGMNATVAIVESLAGAMDSRPSAACEISGDSFNWSTATDGGAALRDLR